MIPGTALALGGGGALSRDVGGSGNLQQSPLQYRGSGDTVQTIEGLRLNNLCAQGAVQRRLLERRQLPGDQLRDRRRLGRNGPGRHARQHGARRTAATRSTGQSSATSRRKAGRPTTAIRPASAQAVHAAEPRRRPDLQPEQHAHQRQRARQDLGLQPVVGGPIMRDKVWFYATFRYWGVNKTVADSFFDADPSPFSYAPDLDTAGHRRRPHPSASPARVSAQITQQGQALRTTTTIRTRYRDHWGIAANDPARASAIQATPTSFVTVTKWTRTHTNRLLFDAGFGDLRPGVHGDLSAEVTGRPTRCGIWTPFATRGSTRVTRSVRPTGKIAGAWNNPADHFSMLRTVQVAASYVTGSHSLRFGGARQPGDWRLVAAVHRRRAADHLQRRPRRSAGDAAHPDRPPQRDQGRHRHVRAGPLDDGPRHDQRRPALRLVHRRDRRRATCSPSRFNAGTAVRQVPGRQEQSERRLRRHGAELEGHLAARRRRLRPVRQRPDGGEGERRALRRRPADRRRRQHQPGDARSACTDTRPWTRPRQQRSAVRRQRQHPVQRARHSTATPTFGRNVSTTHYDPGGAERLGQARLQHANTPSPRSTSWRRASR